MTRLECGRVVRQLGGVSMEEPVVGKLFALLQNTGLSEGCAASSPIGVSGPGGLDKELVQSGGRAANIRLIWSQD